MLMAEGKKTFVLYTDYVHTVCKLTDVKAGKLFKHLLKYVNDEDPVAPDQIIELVFEPIKQQLKRDLKSWEQEKNKRSEAGKKGMKSRWKGTKNDTSITKDKSVIQTITPITDNVNVNVIVNDNVNVSNNVPTYVNGQGFEIFWKVYPKKKSKGAAEKAWRSIRPDEKLLQAMVNSIEQAKQTEQWKKEGGQFIPHPATWLRSKGWEDESIIEVKQTKHIGEAVAPKA